MDPATEALLAEVQARFPCVSKPEGLNLSFHRDDCSLCTYLRRDLARFSDPVLPREALREIFCEMSCLSAAAWRWALPSYLKHCLTMEDPWGDDETEFLIFNLGPDPEYQADTIVRLACLDAGQVACLIHFLAWCRAHPYWGEIWQDDIDRALEFMRGLQR